MRDELFDRDYQAARDDLNEGIDRALRAITEAAGKALRVHHRLQWGAPWNRNHRHQGRA